MGHRTALVTVPATHDGPPSVAELVYLNTLLRLPEACSEVGTSLKTLQRAYVNGRLPVVPYGARGKRIRRRDLLAWSAAGAPTNKERP
jgi:hypothetical protein